MNPIVRIYKYLYNYFDKFEDRMRGRLSRSPILYAFIAGISIVLFWRGVWHTADMLERQGGVLGALFSGPGSIILTIIVMLATGLFISFFVGDVIIMSGLRHEKKVVDRTEDEVKEEQKRLRSMEQTLEEVREELQHIHKEHSSVDKSD